MNIWGYWDSFMTIIMRIVMNYVVYKILSYSRTMYVRLLGKYY